MQLTPLTRSHLEAAVALYELSFPPAERRATSSWTDLIEHSIATPGRTDFTPFALIDEQANFCGFITAWQLDGCVYGEHFATLPARRGQGLGGQAFEAFLHQFEGQTVVIEVEPAEDGDLARRRIGFYERHGMHLLSVPYMQPPYEPRLPSLPLRLMTNLPKRALPVISHIIRQIYTRVYGLSPQAAAILCIK